MDCKMCGLHILATMQIMWGGYPFHADCIGEAVAQRRAEEERRLAGIESFEEEFPDGINGDDYDEFEDYENSEIDAEMADFPDVSDEVLNQIPISKGNNSIIIPEAAEPPWREVHINDVVAIAAQQFAAERVERVEQTERNKQTEQAKRAGTLMVGRDARLVSRDFLATLPAPESTATFKPIHHAHLVDQIMDSLWYRRMTVVRDEYAVSEDGMKMFGLIELDLEYKGVRFAIGLRNANDRSMRVAMVAGYKVTVCSNMMLQGDFQPMLAKHSKNFELQDALSIACDRVQRNFGRLHQEITDKQEHIIEPAFARELCYRAFTDGKFPISLMRSVHSEYFEKPSYKEFEKPTLFSLENAFTTAFKKLQPVAQFQATARLGKFLAAYN